MGKASSLSTKKRLRQSKKAQARNRANKTQIEIATEKGAFDWSIGDKAGAAKSLPETYSIIDKAVKKGVLA